MAFEFLQGGQESWRIPPIVIIAMGFLHNPLSSVHFPCSSLVYYSITDEIGKLPTFSFPQAPYKASLGRFFIVFHCRCRERKSEEGSTTITQAEATKKG